MTVRLYDGGGAEIEDLELSSFELVSEESAACDGLLAVFYAESGVERIYGARTAQVYSGGEKVFFGYVDSVRAAQDGNGLRVYVYARSSACLLVDSEAFPGQYSCPTSRQLWHMHAKSFGFGFALPEIASQHDYVVTKGQSCFGAINTFMQYACGRGIYADAENNLRLLDSSGAPAQPDTGRLISASAKADRSSVIGRIGRMSFFMSSPEDRDLMDDVIIETNQALEMTTTYSQIIKGTRQLVEADLNNSLSTIMKFLTSITLIIAIPTLVASFYGMNVTLPGDDYPYTYIVLLGVMAVICIVAIWRLQKRGMWR